MKEIIKVNIVIRISFFLKCSQNIVIENNPVENYPLVKIATIIYSLIAK